MKNFGEYMFSDTENSWGKIRPDLEPNLDILDKHPLIKEVAARLCLTKLEDSIFPYIIIDVLGMGDVFDPAENPLREGANKAGITYDTYDFLADRIAEDNIFDYFYGDGIMDLEDISRQARRLQNLRLRRDE
jgi:hypothetical protein